MKQQLDELMAARGLDAVIVNGAGDHNPAMVYLSGGGHFKASLVKVKGQAAAIYCYPMEREEAARTGLKTKVHQTLKTDPASLAVETRWMLQDNGLNSGRVAFYGQVDAGEFLSLMQEFQRIAPEYVLVGETQDSILMSARATKENDEIERIRRMGKVTTQVVGRVADMLSTAALRGNQLLNHAGEVLRVGEVKQQINLWLAEAGAENPEGTIFSIGRDAGVPHSTGSAGDALELGKTIVFDIFPCEAQGGYFYDFTRTWCLGYAPDEVLKVYEDVLHVYQTVVSRLAPGKPCKEYQNLTCELFGKQGHPTIQSNPGTTDGYVHSLGHGLGLAVHEAPWFSLSMPGEDRLIPGSVFTIEPGLYYPERGIGVRLEDTYLAEANGTFTKLADFPMDLILPTRKG